MDLKLNDKVALITGSSRGLGLASARALVEEGCRVAICARGESRLQEVAELLRQESERERVLSVVSDLSVAAGVSTVVRRTIETFGRLDILVNNARVEFGKPFVDVTEVEWAALMDFNVKSMFLCCQAVGRQMLAQGVGRIVNIGSGLAVRGLSNSAVACAGQGAIHQLTSALALEWARYNIRVNAIGAGWVTSEPSAESPEQELLARYIPSRRKGHPSDLCGLLVYLASDACDFVTGQMMCIDGGATSHA